MTLSAPIVFEKDFEVLDFLNGMQDHKTVVLPKVPTAENMALIAFELLSEAFLKEFKGLIKPINVRLFETPNNWADAS